MPVKNKSVISISFFKNIVSIDMKLWLHYFFQKIRDNSVTEAKFLNCEYKFCFQVKIQ